LNTIYIFKETIIFIRISNENIPLSIKEIFWKRNANKNLKKKKKKKKIKKKKKKKKLKKKKKKT